MCVNNLIGAGGEVLFSLITLLVKSYMQIAAQNVIGLVLQKVINRQGVDLLEVKLPKDAIYVLSRRIRLGWVSCWCCSSELHPASVR
jgi:hypothetical protein